MHALRIHALLWRTVRSPEDSDNTEVTIVSIICAAAKQAGKQYSKRMLPPFVIPYCQVGREGVLAYLKRFPDGRVVYAAGVAMLGARDIRTIRRHIALGLQSVAAAALALASLLSGLPALATLPEHPVGQSPREYLEELAAAMHRAARRAGAEAASRVPAIVYVHLVSMIERSAQPPPIPLSCVLRAVVLHDTS